jgi:hypothetical protein
MAQGQEAAAKQQAKFYLYYGLSGLGSNIGGLMPTLRVYDNKFAFTREQNSYWGERTKKPEFICEGTLQPGAIDSLLVIMQTLGDTTIFSSNPCLLSGVITFVCLAYDGDTAKFTLGNTADSATLKIKEILNPYLPKEEQLYGNAGQIEREKECMHDIIYSSGKERRKERRRKNN